MKNFGRYVALTVAATLVPGVGLACIGEWKKGIGTYAAGFLWWLLFFSLTYQYITGCILFIAGMILLWTCSIIYTLYRARRLTSSINFSLIPRYILWFVLHCCFLYLVFVSFPLKLYRVPSESMAPTLVTGDFFAAAKRDNKVNRGDIIVFSSSGPNPITYVKRIIGLPGESIEVKDGFVHIDGMELEEPYLSDKLRSKRPSWGTRLAEGAPFTVPDNSFFVLGDNRDHSYDSRIFGPISLETVRGRFLYTVRPKSYFNMFPFQGSKQTLKLVRQGDQ